MLNYLDCLAEARHREERSDVAIQVCLLDRFTLWARDDSNLIRRNSIYPDPNEANKRSPAILTHQ
jgi:hypothetical protein